MYNPRFASNIFNSIRQEAGRNALKLARSLKKSIYKLEAHHRHLNFSHRALENRWFTKSLRFKAPGDHSVFKRITERTSAHCTRARINISYNQIRSTNPIIAGNGRKLSNLISDESYFRLSEFLKHRAKSVKNSISGRYEKTLLNLQNEGTLGLINNPNNGVINLSSKLLSTSEQCILSKGPKFASTPSEVPHKVIVAEIEAAITNLSDESGDSVRPKSVQHTVLPNNGWYRDLCRHSYTTVL